MSTKDIGRLGEQIASRFLARKGYRVIEKNYFTRWAEIDLIARAPNGTLAFVEVKTRSSDAFGTPEGAVGEEKIFKFGEAARQWAATHRSLGDQYRLDMVAVELDYATHHAKVRHYENISK